METTETTPLCVFVAKAQASNRLLYGDLRRLQRDVLPTGATSREDVEGCCRSTGSSGSIRTGRDTSPESSPTSYSQCPIHPVTPLMRRRRHGSYRSSHT